ncbi:hypothetical protein BVY00_00365 [bacterium G20]|nr:hypothetical protein BVY00_00365 [bacterium G20]
MKDKTPTPFDQFKSHEYVPFTSVAEVIPFPRRQSESETFLKDEYFYDEAYDNFTATQKKLIAGALATAVAVVGIAGSSTTLGEGAIHRLHQIEHVLGFKPKTEKPYTKAK